jgi:hypothetical protein
MDEVPGFIVIDAQRWPCARQFHGVVSRRFAAGWWMKLLRRTGGRVVEGTALEMRRTCKGTVSSNLTPSAIIYGTNILQSRFSLQKPQELRGSARRPVDCWTFHFRR